MKLDADNLAAEVKAHGNRMKSALWTPSDGKATEHWTASLNVSDEDAVQEQRSFGDSESEFHPPTAPQQVAPDASAQALLPRLDALDRAVEMLTAAVSSRPRGDDGLPGWVATAAGNPHSYDAPDAERTGVCVRILPTTYARIQQVQRRMSLRTTAGAWEFLLRLGIAVAERLPL